MSKKIESYHEFWLFYVHEHSDRRNRALHFIGTSLSIILFICSVGLGSWPLFFAAIVSGYFFAWIGHFVIEKNRPATFTYPFWSLISDFKMWGLTVIGKMPAEIEKSRKVWG